MTRKDSRHADIYKEIKRLRARLYRAQKGLCENTSSKSSRQFKDYIGDLNSQIAWLLLDAGEYEKGLAVYQTLSWRTHGEEKYNGMSRAKEKW